jgi:hypothetical protein
VPHLQPTAAGDILTAAAEAERWADCVRWLRTAKGQGVTTWFSAITRFRQGS